MQHAYIDSGGDPYRAYRKQSGTPNATSSMNVTSSSSSSSSSSPYGNVMAPLVLGRAPQSPHVPFSQTTTNYYPPSSSPNNARQSPFHSGMARPHHRGSIGGQSVGGASSSSVSSADAHTYGTGGGNMHPYPSTYYMQPQQQQQQQQPSHPSSFSSTHSPSGSHYFHASVPSQPSPPPPVQDASQQNHVGIAPLRRGQACQSCRKRKMRCNAVRPVCGTCEKSRKAAAQANHVSPVPEGDCVYDDGPLVDKDVTASNGGSGTPVSVQGGGTMSASRPSSSTPEEGQKAKRPRTVGGNERIPDHGRRSISNSYGVDVMAAAAAVGPAATKETPEQRVVRLESRIAELEEKLRQARWHQGHNWEIGTTPHRFRSRANSREPPGIGESFRPAVPIISMLSPLSGREERHRMLYSQRPARFGQPIPIPGPLLAPVPSTAESATKEEPNVIPIDASTSPTTDEAFMRLLWPGWSNDLPSAETVTSLCEIFFRLHPMRTLVYKPSFMSGLLLPPKHPHRPHDSLVHSILCAAADISPFYERSSMLTGVRDKFALLLSDPFSRPNSQQPHSADILTFKEFHLSKARQKVERSLLTDFRNPLDWISACLITCFVLWNDSRFVEAYFLSGFAARALAPSGLDKLPSRHHSPNGKVHHTPGIFGDPQGIEEHERRIVFWHIFIADQYTSGPPSFYENLVNEQACLTHLPCTMSDFMSGNDVPPNTQMLNSPDLFTNGHLDDFTLHIKSCVLLRRAATLVCRTQMMRSKPSGVAVIDRHIDELLSSFPTRPVHESSCDSLNAYTNISLALFYLHEPYLTKTELCTVRNGGEPLSTTSSNGRILMGVEKMMQVLHELMNTSLDFALLHPQMFLTWSVCARMMGKDMMLMQQRLAQQQKSSSMTTTSFNKDDDNLLRTLKRILDNLDTIVQALHRGGAKSLKAKRCAELVSSVRSGHLHESILSHLLYLDGVIPVEEDLNSGSANPAPNDFGLALSAFPSESSPFDMLMMPMSDTSTTTSTTTATTTSTTTATVQDQSQGIGNATSANVSTEFADLTTDM